MKTILLLGLPGSGKGSIADFLVSEHNFVHISTGNIFRSLAHNDSLTAQKVKTIISNGELVPDELTNQLVKDEFTKIFNEKGDVNVVLDGYPRTIDQANFAMKNFKIDLVLLLSCNEQEILFRLMNRLVCSAHDHPYHLINNAPKVPNICDIDQSLLYQRKDDRQDVILKRLAVYEKTTKPLINFYNEHQILLELDAGRSLEVVKQEAATILKKIIH